MSYIALPEITSTVKGYKQPKFNAFDILGGITGAIGTAYNMYTNKRDFDYQKALQQTMFEREDTAVQRRMADLQAAGINPNLAAGSAAGAGSVVARSNTNDVNMGSALDTAAAIGQIKAQAIQNKILDWDEKSAYYNKEMARVNAETNYYAKDYEKNWYQFLNQSPYSFDKIKEYTPRLYDYFNSLLSQQKNSADILQKQNNWYTTQQLLNAANSIIGDISVFTPHKSMRVPYK